MCSSSIPDYFDPVDPNLDPEKAFCLEGVMDARMLWPEDAEELIEIIRVAQLFQGWRIVG